MLTCRMSLSSGGLEPIAVSLSLYGGTHHLSGAPNRLLSRLPIYSIVESTRGKWACQYTRQTPALTHLRIGQGLRQDWLPHNVLHEP